MITYPLYTLPELEIKETTETSACASYIDFPYPCPYICSNMGFTYLGHMHISKTKPYSNTENVLYIYIYIYI